MSPLDPDACWRALKTRDARFDGRFFTGVTSTGIYCRPVCPATTPKRENCRFFPTAAAAQEAGFRPCLRCRPETAPDAAVRRGASNTVARGLRLIAEGALDAEGAGVETLAERLGVGARHLRRLFDRQAGASPLAVAQTRRVLLAKQLIHETRLPMAEVAAAAGFGSVRRFNAVFSALYGRPPRELRRLGGEEIPAAAGLRLFLPWRPPYDFDAVLGHLDARALEGVERVEPGRWRRTCMVGGPGVVEVARDPAREGLSVGLRLADVRALTEVLARVRRLFDLGADPAAVGEHLGADPLLAPLVAERPGLRAPGAWDPFETAVRAVLGQQVTVRAARGLGARLVALCGETVGVEHTGDPALNRAFPGPERVAAADLSGLGAPGSRLRALRSLALAAAADPRLLQPDEGAVERLKALPGIGEWTAQYVALRALGDADAFPASDAALLREAALRTGATATPADLLARAEAWRPWRAYAAQHLWAADAARTGSPSHDRTRAPSDRPAADADRPHAPRLRRAG